MEDVKPPAEPVRYVKPTVEKRYVKPTVEKLGSLAELTRQHIKQFGLADGFLLQTSDGDLSLTNVS